MCLDLTRLSHYSCSLYVCVARALVCENIVVAKGVITKQETCSLTEVKSVLFYVSHNSRYCQDEKGADRGSGNGLLNWKHGTYVKLRNELKLLVLIVYQ